MGHEIDGETNSSLVDTPMSSTMEENTTSGAETDEASPAEGSTVPENPVNDTLENRKTSGSITSNVKFVKTVSEFAKKLQPWKSIMPTRLRDDLDDMEAFAKEVSGEMDANDPDKWTCEIERCTMQDWRKIDDNERKSPKPVIQAFYLHKPEDPTYDDPGASGVEAEALGDHKNLQRIQINSDLLQTELESIASISVPARPIRIAPPYKLLLHFLPDMEARLSELEDELAKLPLPNLTVEYEKKVAEDGNKGKDSTTGSAAAISPKESDLKESERPAGSSLKRRATTKDSEAKQRSTISMRIEHLRCLCEFIKDELHDILELRSQIQDGSLQSIRFEDLWHLTKPGELIWSTDHGRDQLYKVYAVTGGQIQRRSRNRFEIQEIENIRNRVRYWLEVDEKDTDDDSVVERHMREEASGIGTWTAFKVDCYMMAYNGEHCGPVETCKRIRHYVGERAITTLPMFPVRFHPNKDHLLRTMEERGRLFITSAGHKSYDGRTLAFKREEARVEVQSDVYVDFDAYYQDHPTKKPKIGKLLRSKQDLTEIDEVVVPGTDKYRILSGHEVDLKLADDFMATNRLRLERFTLERNTKLSVEDLYLMPFYVVGYAFQVRKWFTLDLDLIKDIDQKSADARASGFDDLVIPKRYRDLLVALVENHASGLDRQKKKATHAKTGALPTQIDLVRGKGQGLIILLHGPPGSGKTSTAETIAAFTRRPLYSITCGDIGLTPDVVETRLLEHTRRADKWGCVLLLDEADVFLMQRNWQDLERNALVSVFLRQLEYYSGILFLTTNRPGVLDEAFKSRIHISLRYPSIDLESTKQMWSNIMSRLEQENATAEVKIVFDREGLLEYAQKHFRAAEKEGKTWNGRQIRNAFQTALALGHYERLQKIREAGLTVEEAIATGKKKWRTVKLTKLNFTNIAKTAREFEEYIELLRGKDSVLMKEQEFRLDGYDVDAPVAKKKYPSSLASSKLGSRGGKGKKAVKEESESEDEEESEEQEEEESEELSADEDD